MMPLILPGGTGMRARHFTPIVLALALAGTALVAHTVGSWMSYVRQPSGWTARPQPQAVLLGDTRLSVPANLIRRAEERVASGRLKRLNLAVLWPTLEGYSEPRARAFADASDASAVIRLALTEDAGGMDTSERLEKVWLTLAGGEALPGPSGLALLPLPGDASAGADFVAHRALDDGLFAARCFTPRDKALAASCERSIRLGDGLFLTYRFRQALLADWRRLDDRLAGLVRALVD